MAIYEYFCKECNFKFEEFHEIGSGDSSNCPECNQSCIKIMSIPRINTTPWREEQKRDLDWMRNPD
ncbi:MAG: hypothetical protein COY53_07255 [Elusimicrobia bacterium CG_4_10_14_0_8_um_filter_37_32]|nr:MAG: hypothetical protein COY53_07255 [Elusimicrobia bacterium CG_4_10_14_0_8_um_filter_37_32]